jgi:GNAT superfamily N-acetyltransferase
VEPKPGHRHERASVATDTNIGRMDDVLVAVAYDIRTVAEDCSDLIALRRLWHPGDDEAFEQNFRTWWERERRSRFAVVAYAADGTPVGMANGQVFSRMPAPGHHKAQWMYGANVFVVDRHRRNGVARQLMLALIEFARANGMVRVVLAPSEMSVPLYRSLGFRTAHDLMRLDL